MSAPEFLNSFPDVAASLSGKRFALVGLSGSHAAAVQQTVEHVDGFTKIFAGDVPEPGARQFQAFDILVVSPSGVPGDAWSSREKLALNDKPLLFVGTYEQLLKQSDLTSAFAHDFLLLPSAPAEVLLRAYHILAQSTNQQPLVRREGPPRVVVADDDPTTTMMLKTVLARAGFECHPVSDGGEALALARRLKPDALILDVNMPVMDGFEVLSAVRHEASLSATRVVMLTSLHQEVDVLRGFNLGADDYVVKPFNPLELSARIKRLVRV